MIYGVWQNKDISENGLPWVIDGDNKVDDKYLIFFRQYLDGKDVSVDEQALNVDGIGEVDESDYSMLFKYLTGWNVKIYYGGEPAEETVFTVTSAEKEYGFEKGEIWVGNETASFYWTVCSSHDWRIISSVTLLSASAATG